MNAFASDLDRTLIYSRRMIGTPDKEAGIELVETLNGRELSYISSAVKEHLNQIQKDHYFIPVTTRTNEQYKRIVCFQQDIVPEYAVTTNGGCILRDGEPLKEWDELMKEELASCLPIEAMLREIAGLSLSEAVKRTRIAHHYFVYLILHEEKIPYIDISAVKEWGADKGWQVSLQGRKLYFIPNPLNKWKAVEYLKSRLSLDEIYTAGDSLLDLELIREADFGIAPAHGEVLSHDPKLRKTVASGMLAGEEITASVLSQISKLKHV
ncbi:HAD family hydrolase [Bacillus mojavensis]|uniref:HAD family hydrolase n=1 Tax=Bacillus mojavensis TaxID=72360 RepID=UPI002DBFB9ED|nr:HAD family hydrolase [Bacillus mojavensis]MEC1289194.1 HAD family hydrolase [Bacillus mojavensis]MEC1635208.1 HAD family hydrolase [Bacillus mojavensis]MEC1705508.1 HAD family hydrolase [Bacillus mojavensis]MEC5245442.1 HAD family hydrolase [Bacillus mojavensis]